VTAVELRYRKSKETIHRRESNLICPAKEGGVQNSERKNHEALGERLFFLKKTSLIGLGGRGVRGKGGEECHQRWPGKKRDDIILLLKATRYHRRGERGGEEEAVDPSKITYLKRRNHRLGQRRSVGRGAVRRGRESSAYLSHAASGKRSHGEKEDIERKKKRV